MKQIDSITVRDGTRERTVSFWHGNPADIPKDDPVDLIIVSAFNNDYTPTQWSIIGALDRKGLSVGTLAEDKAVDLRDTAGFWLSKPLARETAVVGANRILCFEPFAIGTQPVAVVGNLFRGLFPFLSDAHEMRVAMAVIGTGAIGADPAEMLRALVTAATTWMQRGLPIRELRIMEQNAGRVERLEPVFREFRTAEPPRDDHRTANEFQVFLSFSTKDATAADQVGQTLRARMPDVRVFDYRISIDNGKVWQDEIDKAMRSCMKMIALLSPSYFGSPECREELSVGRLLHKRRNHSFLYPLYTHSLATEDEMPYWLETITYLDCREDDAAKLAAAAERLDLRR